MSKQPVCCDHPSISHVVFSSKTFHHSHNDASVIIILDYDPKHFMNNMLRETMRANKQYTLDKFSYLFERSFTMRNRPIPIEFALDKEVVCTYIHLNLFGFLQQRQQFREWNSKSIMFELVQFNGIQLMNLSTELRDDREIVKTAVMNNPNAIKYASEKLQNDWEIVSVAMKQDPLVYEYIGHESKKDPNFIRMALSSDGLLLGCLPVSVSEMDPNYLEYVKIAINQNPNAILLAPQDIQDDENIQLDCMKKSPLLSILISSHSQISKEIAVELVTKDERTYQFLPVSCKKDKDVILAMLERNINCVDLIGQNEMENEDLMIEILKYFPQCYERLPFSMKMKDKIIEAMESSEIDSYYEIDIDKFPALYLEKSKVKSWLTTRKVLPVLTSIDKTSTTPYKENARLIMHFGNAYYREHSVLNSVFNSQPESKYGRFPIQINTI